MLLVFTIFFIENGSVDFLKLMAIFVFYQLVSCIIACNMDVSCARIASGIHHLVLPTRDYLFAPSMDDICKAVDLIHVLLSYSFVFITSMVLFGDENASSGQRTYVHCKAGRGRSTIIVVCYLVNYKGMMPDVAYNYVKSIRPRVLLASSQWQSVQEFYHLQVKKICALSSLTNLFFKSPKLFTGRDFLSFDDGAVVVITKADIDGYENSGAVRNEIWADLSFIYRIRVAGGTALIKLSCLLLRCHSGQKVLDNTEANLLWPTTWFWDVFRMVIRLFPDTLPGES
ncbi:hypothetical protein ACH5RR_040281 [Cinchona calisaya]|uniref:Tyrosine specific protein phosphatases domain-containing protein n=1 Tax=Cinchona calisaya TaxID=153742 RepID=A0ABD2XRP5_9GENT